MGRTTCSKKTRSQSHQLRPALCVLLIDEIDRADEELRAFLARNYYPWIFQIGIPELGTIRSAFKPLVVLTSNRTRELSDALKRRCLYHWVNYPSMDKEIRIIKKHLPDIEERLAEQIVAYVDRIRNLKLDKAPGIAETIDWARGIALLNGSSEAMVQSLACLLKSDHDIKRVMEDIF